MDQLLCELNGENYKGSTKDGLPDGKVSVCWLPCAAACSIAERRNHAQGTVQLGGGLSYEGELAGGSFQGPGTIVFPNGGRFVGIFNQGILQQGKYYFKDELAYKPSGWDYCTVKDRRFWDEIKNGISFGDKPRVTNGEAPALPKGVYDLGDGYYDPAKRTIFDYKGKELSKPTDEEAANIVKKFRLT